MVEFFQFLFLALALLASLAGVGSDEDWLPIAWLRRIAARQHLVVFAVGCVAFMGCIAVAGVLHEPVPRIDDEFSYILTSDTLASGHVANPTPSSGRAQLVSSQTGRHFCKTKKPSTPTIPLFDKGCKKGRLDCPIPAPKVT
jgi:hypothetical protein